MNFTVQWTYEVQEIFIGIERDMAWSILFSKEDALGGESCV